MTAWTQQDETELQAILARGSHYPDRKLFMPSADDETRYYELIERKSDYLWTMHKRQYEGDWNT